MRLHVLSATLAMVVALAPAALEADERMIRGQELFLSQGCYGCHTIGALGTPIAPDLSHVGFKYPKRYLEAWLRDPSAQKPTAHMPRISLSEDEVRALAAYLSSLQ